MLACDWSLTIRFTNDWEDFQLKGLHFHVRACRRDECEDEKDTKTKKKKGEREDVKRERRL